MNMNENNEQPMTDAAAEHEAETSDSCDIGPETDCAADDSGAVDLNPPPSPKPKRRKRRLLLLCVGAVMLAVFGFAVWFKRRKK